MEASYCCTYEPHIYSYLTYVPSHYKWLLKSLSGIHDHGFHISLTFYWLHHNPKCHRPSGYTIYQLWLRYYWESINKNNLLENHIFHWKFVIALWLISSSFFKKREYEKLPWSWSWGHCTFIYNNIPLSHRTKGSPLISALTCLRSWAKKKTCCNSKTLIQYTINFLYSYKCK